MFLGINYYLNANGTPMMTENETDFYIEGKGFFVVYDEKTKGILLTRNGSFQTTLSGYLCNQDGYLVLNKESDINNGVLNYVRYDELFDGGVIIKESNVFLLMMPVGETVKSVSPLYIISSENSIIDNRQIRNMFLETMPVNLRMLLDHAIECIENQELVVDSDKSNLLYLLNKRYAEILEIKFIDKVYYDNLLGKIKEFENLLLNYGVTE
jgi:hypothetical protein